MSSYDYQTTEWPLPGAEIVARVWSRQVSKWKFRTGPISTRRGKLLFIVRTQRTPAEAAEPEEPEVDE